MSWRTGAELFREMWPLLQRHISNRSQRRQFAAQLLQVFMDNDLDPYDVGDLHPEVAAALKGLGYKASGNSSEDDDVACCVQRLDQQDEKARAEAAEALRHFVYQAADPAAAAQIALKGLMSALRDKSVKVRRQAALSVHELLKDGFELSSQLRKKLETVLGDGDEVVQKRIKTALQVEEKARRK